MRFSRVLTDWLLRYENPCCASTFDFWARCQPSLVEGLIEIAVRYEINATLLFQYRQSDASNGWGDTPIIILGPEMQRVC
jgi:hypothetical protein